MFFNRSVPFQKLEKCHILIIKCLFLSMKVSSFLQSGNGFILIILYIYLYSGVLLQT